MHLHIISRDQAKSLGLKFYFSGQPCVSGFYGLRNVNSNQCFCEHHRDLARNAAKKYKSENYEKIKQREKIARSTPERKAKLAERDRLRLEKNREQMNAKKREWYHKNKQRAEETHQKWRERIGEDAYKAYVKKHGRKRYEKNKEKIIGQVLKWRNENKESVKIYARATAAKRRSAAGAYTKKDVQDILEKQKHKCAYCKKSVKDGYHVDHVVPLARGGTNWPDNLQILCPFCNLSKGVKDPIEYAQQNGRLL